MNEELTREDAHMRAADFNRCMENFHHMAAIFAKAGADLQQEVLKAEKRLMRYWINPASKQPPLKCKLTAAQQRKKI